MLDGIQNEKKSYSAVKMVNVGDDKTVKMTMHFTAYNDSEAQSFLNSGDYEGYKLVSNELREVVGDNENVSKTSRL